MISILLGTLLILLLIMVTEKGSKIFGPAITIFILCSFSLFSLFGDPYDAFIYFFGSGIFFYSQYYQQKYYKNVLIDYGSLTSHKRLQFIVVLIVCVSAAMVIYKVIEFFPGEGEDVGLGMIEPGRIHYNWTLPLLSSLLLFSFAVGRIIIKENRNH